jgi:hypothetical protein
MIAAVRSAARRRNSQAGDALLISRPSGRRQDRHRPAAGLMRLLVGLPAVRAAS